MSFFGISGSGGESIIPFAGGDIAVTEARLLYNGYPGRVRYALPFGTGNLKPNEVIDRQKSIPRRMAAAAMMTNEINLIGGSVANPMISLAIGKIWGWALRP